MINLLIDEITVVVNNRDIDRAIRLLGTVLLVAGFGLLALIALGWLLGLNPRGVSLQVALWSILAADATFLVYIRRVDSHQENRGEARV